MTNWERELVWGLIESFKKYNTIVPCRMNKYSEFQINNEKELDELLNKEIE